MKKYKIFLLICFLISGCFFLCVKDLKAEYAVTDLPDPFVAQFPERVVPKEVVPVEVPEEVLEEEEAVAPPDIKVDAFISGGPVPQAIIGGKIVRIGEEIGTTEAILTEVTKEGITVLYKLKNFSFPGPSRRFTVEAINVEKVKKTSEESVTPNPIEEGS